MLVVVVGCSAQEPDDSGAEAEERATPVAGYEVEARDLSRSVQVSGTVEPVERYQINAYGDGVLTSLNVEEGEGVDEGQLLASTQLDEYRAERERARAEARKFERRLERREPLVDRDAVGEAELEELRSELEVAEREVDVWESRIELGELRAPTDGVVTARHVDPGSSVAANEEILQLADVSTLVVPIRLSERDVVELERDQQVDVRIDALGDETSLEASIRRVFPAADADSRRVTVELQIEEIPDELTVKPGFRARATIEVDRRDEMLVVPGESLLASDGDDEFVYVIEDDELVRRSVETGIDRRNWTEITEGLEGGEVIVGMNPTNLREEMPVHVSQWVDPEKL